MPNFVKIAWYGKHFGEEPPLVGRPSASSGRILAQAQKCGAGPSARLGAGTIFFSGCNLRCVFCQNYQISQQGLGRKYSVEELATIMLGLERPVETHRGASLRGAVNIDLVSPTIWAEPVKQAIRLAKKQGLTLPVVWNSNAYEDIAMIKSLAGLVDIYLPDFKYADDELALKYSGVKKYTAKAKEAISEMFKQAGNLRLDERGLAVKGLIVRHLVLPGAVANSLHVLDTIKAISPEIRVSLMSQYAPVFKAEDYPEINRRISQAEYESVLDYLVELGLDNGWTQALDGREAMLPDFRKEEPFKR